MLLLMMMRQKDLLNDNELTWLASARKLGPEQIKILTSDDAEERALVLASMKTNTFQQAEALALTKYSCPGCKEHMIKKCVVMMSGGRTMEVSNAFECSNCDRRWFAMELAKQNQ